MRDRRAQNSWLRQGRKLIILGGFLASVAIVVPFAGAFSPVGKLDRSFGEGGRVLATLGTSLGTSNFRAVVRQSDGKLLIGAEPSTPKGGHSLAIQRRNPDGSLDSSFGEGAGSIEVATLNGLALQPDGRILVANASGSCSSSDALRRFLPGGVPDLTFGADDAASIYRRADRAWEAAGIPERLRLHQARHTYASFMIAAGVNAKALSVFIGSFLDQGDL